MKKGRTSGAEIGLVGLVSNSQVQVAQSSVDRFTRNLIHDDQPQGEGAHALEVVSDDQVELPILVHQVQRCRHGLTSDLQDIELSRAAMSDRVVGDLSVELEEIGLLEEIRPASLSETSRSKPLKLLENRIQFINVLDLAKVRATPGAESFGLFVQAASQAGIQ